MSTSLFMVFMACVAGVMGGLVLSNRTRNRERYFAELLNLMDRLISDISFLQQPVDQILKMFECKSVHLSKNISEYLDFTQGCDFSFSGTVLTKREAEIIKDFFDRLGTLDLNSQLNELSAKRSLFAQFHAAAEKRNNSFGKAYIKLGFLAGLAVGILLI